MKPKSKLMIMVELEYMRRGLVSPYATFEDVSSGWSKEQHRVHARKFRKVFRKALNWERDSIIRQEMLNQPAWRFNDRKALLRKAKKVANLRLERVTSVNPNRENWSAKTAYWAMMNCRRNLVKRYITYVVKQNQKLNKKKMGANNGL